ncbi:hypothetical protein K493DRAFT_317325 [Basidiobolus meristosporus CBS 931.73]|uniref:Uncharacterized protein n=1 Tax=Basidiobolus meristosporus CBS 931.73 TaxID=1314790 RepID=A0A1Y1Y0C1_9FUNG|nr:hypothetical protein K493DRAFT_317325 [Basidiobolus meristosporus CBS 931.73]|eukprot:ORX91345.1 hypothetical protein K493DRAFT_317325 [Basidiobolus meristosporus CBS 931.73]
MGIEYGWPLVQAICSSLKPYFSAMVGKIKVKLQMVNRLGWSLRTYGKHIIQKIKRLMDTPTDLLFSNLYESAYPIKMSGGPDNTRSSE